jgi:transposase
LASDHKPASSFFAQPGAQPWLTDAGGARPSHPEWHRFAKPRWDCTSLEWLAIDRALGEDELARKIARLVDEELDLTSLYSSYAGRGSLPHRPDLLLKLALYEIQNGRHRPTQWLKDLKENTTVQWLTFGIQASRSVLYEFRDRVGSLLEGLNRQVIRTAINEEHTDVADAALDGTFVAANASRHRLVTLETVERRLEQLDQEIAKIEEAETAQSPCQSPTATDANLMIGTAMPAEPPTLSVDTAPVQQPSAPPAPPTGLTATHSRPPSFMAETKLGKKRQRSQYQKARKILKERNQKNGRRRKDKRKKPEQIRVAIGDPMAPFGRDKVEVFAPWNENSFTAQKRAQAGEDSPVRKDQFTWDETIPGYQCPQGHPLTFRERTSKQKANGDSIPLEIYQAAASDCAECPLKNRCVHGRSGARTVRRQPHEELIDRKKARTKSPEGKELYRMRSCTVERRFADAKSFRGLERFSGKSSERAAAQVGLTMLAHNLVTIDKLRMRKAACENTAKIVT